MRKPAKLTVVKLPEGLRKNERLKDPIFTPAAKNDVGHDEDISVEQMIELSWREADLRAARAKHYALRVGSCDL